MKTGNWQLPRSKITELKNKESKYCICIPVKDEGKKIKKQLSKMQKVSDLPDIIIADWGSADGSTDPKLLKKLGVRTLLVKKSHGKQATQLRMAFAYALKQGYKGIIQIDGNNKDGVDAIPKFVKALDEGFDYLQGSRFIPGGKEKNTPATRKWGIKLVVAPLLSLAAGKFYTDVTNGFRGYSRKYLLHKEVQPFRDVFVSYALNFYLTVRANQLRLKTKEIPVSRVYPKGSVPTKMSKLKGPLQLVQEAVMTATGRYHPH